MHDYSTAIFINAPATKVWQIMTTPQPLRDAIDGEIEATWEKESPFRIKYIWEGQTFIEKGMIHEAEAPSLLRLSYLPILSDLEDKPQNYQHVSMRLHEVDGDTQLEVELQNVQGDFLIQRIPEIWSELLHQIKSASEQ